MPPEKTAETSALSLRAENKQDLEIISACLQDGLTRVADMAFQRQKKRFALGIIRYMWENAPDLEAAAAKKTGRRVQAGLHFDFVDRVELQNIDQRHRDGLLPLLTISAEEQDPETEITLTFAGGGAIRLTAECIDCQLQDIGESWSAQARPDHGLDAE